MTVLVTGGAGYIGSHVVRLLENQGRDVVVVDDLSTGVADRVLNSPLVAIDLASNDAEHRLVSTFETHNVKSVIHFAAKKQVGESVERPIWYYRQNVGGLANLLAAMQTCQVNSMVFSSSAAAYGNPNQRVVAESVECRPINPYGQTKLIGEWMISNAEVAGLKGAKLRYFNVAGAGWADLADTAIMNLIPIVINQVASGGTPVIFGNDYPTPDGTCIRDYVHVKDLAEAHLSALDYVEAGGASNSVFNVGTGRGASVSEVIDVVGRVLGVPIQPEMGERRAGDPAELVADVSAIRTELGWKSEYELEDIVRSAIEAMGTPRP
ncbi:UDP-glucose 4-epimerase GalE [Brevibacterium daeguense]|uniref:UDP-glucose 4-epimerase n=1 Tax=Brevibacterium daeguense TaxID=909936 RepID=A0ABP8EG40_9MICO|nr:UDP-glucose 4-epimerase GalE [Brevibacterium daeguense]